MRHENQWNEVDLRDNRYNQIIHMVSAASGAEDFYTCSGHKTRSEDLGVARDLDDITAQVRSSGARSEDLGVARNLDDITAQVHTFGNSTCTCI